MVCLAHLLNVVVISSTIVPLEIVVVGVEVRGEEGPAGPNA